MTAHSSAVIAIATQASRGERLCGLVFGWLRWATGSTILTMLLHGLVNCEGMFETFMVLRS
jgi:hypothetical protein